MDTSTELRETERRVLGNLPAYRDAEGQRAAIKDALEVGTIQKASEWPTGRTLADLTARVTADPHSAFPPDEPPAVLEAVAEEYLTDLRNRGLVEQDGDQWAMTEAGLDALTA